jgi:hypothetical protein
VTRSGPAASAVAALFEVEIADKAGECARLPLLECWRRVLERARPSRRFQSYQGQKNVTDWW